MQSQGFQFLLFGFACFKVPLSKFIVILKQALHVRYFVRAAPFFQWGSTNFGELVLCLG